MVNKIKKYFSLKKRIKEENNKTKLFFTHCFLLGRNDEFSEILNKERAELDEFSSKTDRLIESNKPFVPSIERKSKLI